MFEVLSEKWPDILEFFKNEYDISDVSFNTWIIPLEIKSVDDNLVTLVFTGSSGSQGLKYINKKYLTFLKVSICEVLAADLDLQIILPDGSFDTSISTNKTEDINLLERIQESNLNKKYTFENFVVGSNNNAAQVTALAVAESPGETYNPLYIYGGVGLGKTHLLQSIGNFILKSNPTAKVLYATSESFVNEVIALMSPSNNNQEEINSFRKKYKNVDVLLIDDIQFFAKKKRCQEELFNIFNDLYMNHKQIVFTSDKVPKELEGIEERLINRFEMGLTVDIQNPDYETRMAILKNKADSSDIIFKDDVLDYIANNFISNVRELEGSLTKVIAFSKMSQDSEINVDFAKNVLKDMVDPNIKNNITCGSIIDIVAEHYGISRSDIASKKRNAEFTKPRQVCMYLCRIHTDEKLQTIAAELKKTNHATVSYACEKIKEEIETDQKTKELIDVLNKKIIPN